jgi:hypothetical protein
VRSHDRRFDDISLWFGTNISYWWSPHQKRPRRKDAPITKWTHGVVGWFPGKTFFLLVFTNVVLISFKICTSLSRLLRLCVPVITCTSSIVVTVTACVLCFCTAKNKHHKICLKSLKGLKWLVNWWTNIVYPLYNIIDSAEESVVYPISGVCDTSKRFQITIFINKCVWYFSSILKLGWKHIWPQRPNLTLCY